MVKQEGQCLQLRSLPEWKSWRLNSNRAAQAPGIPSQRRQRHFHVPRKRAQMLGVSIASLQRLEKGRELPELRRAGGTHGPTSAPRHPVVSKEE